ncbi:hypothetical protein BH10PSE17_BH10PSE17_11190 [soil metagenome]
MKTCLMVASLATALAATGPACAQTNPFQKDGPAAPADQSKASPWTRSSTPFANRPAGTVSNDLGPDNSQRKAGGATSGLDAARNRSDSQADLSAEQQLKAQMVSERQAKANAAMSNIMKKNSDTTQSITGNVK